MLRSRQKKSQPQVQSYHRFLKQSGTYSPNTVGYEYNENLQGSDQISDGFGIPAIRPQADVVPTSLKYKVKDWVKDHGVDTIIALILIPLLGWLISSVVVLQKDNAVLYERIDNIKASLSQIKDGSVDKELLNVKLELLRSEVKNSTAGDKEDIISELNQIEKRVDIIEHK